MLDSYTKDMLFTNILNEYSDKEQLDIIEYLVEYLMSNQTFGMEKNSIEELYYNGLMPVYKAIEDLKIKEHDFTLNK